MAQNIQLKRSALPGKVPDTGSLNLGELAVNTYDGKVFIKRSGSVESIQELITTNATNTGSITLTKTGSFGELVVTQDANIQRDLYVTNDIIGNGDLDILGNITGSNLLIKGTLTAQSYIVSSSVVNMTTQFASGSTIFGNTLDDTHRFTGSVQISGSFTSSLQQGYTWVGDGNNVSVLVPTSSFGGVLPAGVVSGSTQLTSSYDVRYALSGTIGSQFYKKVETFTAIAGQVTFTTAALMSAGNVDVFVNGVKLLPNEFTITSTNTLDLLNPSLVGESVDIEMFSAFGGTIGYFELTGIPNGLISGSQQLTSSYDTRYALSGSGVSVAAGTVSGSSQLTSSYDTRYVLSGSITQTTWDNIASKPGGIVSGSSQLTSSYDTRYAASASYLTSLNGAISGSSQLTSSYDTRYALSGSGGSIPAGTISGSSQLTSSYDTRYALSGSAGSTEFYKTTQLFTASAGQTSFTIAGNATAGNVDVFINGTKLVQTDFTIPDIHTITLVTGSITGQIVDIQTFNTYAVTTTAQGGGKLHTQSTAASTWTFAHNLGAQYPNVTVYNSSNQIIVPSSITANTVDLMTLEFGTAVAGYAVVGIGGIIDAEGKTAKQQFTSSLEWRFEHKLGDRFIAIQTFNNSYEMIVPQNITLTDVTSSTITFPTPVAGWAVGTIGGGLPAISSSNAGNYLRVSETAPYTASWIPAVDITVTNAITASHLNPISQSLVPAFSGTYDLGSIAKPWRHIYVGTGSIYLVDDKATVTKTLTANTIVTTTDIASGSINLATSLPAGIVSHSAQVVNILSSVNSFTASNNITSLNSFTSSAARTNVANTFTANQTITGSLYITQDLVIGGSAAIQTISSSRLDIGDNIIQLNVNNPSLRFGGIEVFDSGSAGGSGSILYDSVQDEWIFVHRGNGVNVTSSHFVMGPETYDNVGNESYLTNNRIPKGTGKEHLNDSNISDTGTLISLGSNTQITGSLIIGAASNLYPVNVYTSSANANNVIAEFWNGDYTAGTKNFIRVRNAVSLGSTMSSYFGQGQDGNTYITSNDFARGGDIVIGGTTGDVTFAGNVIPKTNNSKDLGSATYGWRNIYTNDLHLSNEGKPEGNDVDGTTGNWTIQEGAEHLYIINNKTGKKFKFSLEEIQ